MNGIELLAEYRVARAESAFNELIRRYTNLVYSVAKRRVNDATLAQEVTQIVFIRLAKTPPSLGTEPQLLAWLHRTTVHVSVDLWRAETRRHAREQSAVAMQTHSSEDTAWTEMKPALDAALDGLNEPDRQAILLRFFEQKSMAELGAALGISEDAAKMRVSRALERLRNQLSTLGVPTGGTALLGSLMLSRSVEAAPNGLIDTLLAAKLPMSVGAAGGLASLLLSGAKAKLLASIAAALLCGGFAWWGIRGMNPATGPSPHARQIAPASQSEASNNQVTAKAGNSTNDLESIRDPDPLKLLQGVAKARQRIRSGIIEYDSVARVNIKLPGHTNRMQLKVQFEEGRRWFDTLGQEYRYITPVPSNPEAEAIIKRADQLPREQAIREGLLAAFPSHHVYYYDGEVVTDYWETDSPHPTTTIRKSDNAGVACFDPRCLGFIFSLHSDWPLEKAWGYDQSSVLRLAGKEMVEGKECWHIQDLTISDFKRDFWLETKNPERLLKYEANGEVITSCYSEKNAHDPLPVEVHHVSLSRGAVQIETHLTRRTSKFNVPIDPACWTLEGLHMKVGTDVSDDRVMQIIGYWNGASLSKEPNPKPVSATANRADMMALLNNNPAAPEALDAAEWIMLNTPDGAEVQKAAEVILQEHIENPDLVHLAPELERLRHSSSTNLLRAMMDKNPNPAVHGNACLALANLYKEAADYGQNKPATAEAEKLYQQVIAQFSQVKQRGYSLAALAKSQLKEVNQLFIGKKAPEIEGMDLNDRPMKLSDYRGKVVVLVFWSAPSFTQYEAQELRQLAEQMHGKPFALLGIQVSDDYEKALEKAAQFEITWPSFQDGRNGPIGELYNVNSWLTFFVLDRQGVIRSRGLHHRESIASAVEKLLQE